MPGLTGVVQVAAGGLHSLALRSDGTVWERGAWSMNGADLTPAEVPGLTGVTKIAAGDGFSLALRSDGTVWAWGADGDGQLGNTPTAAPVTRPVETIGLESGITQISAGATHVLALQSNGTVLAWGGNAAGELGTGSTGPTAVAYTLFFRGLRSAAASTAALLALLEPLTGAVLAALVLGERLSVTGLAGAAAIGAAVLVTVLANRGQADPNAGCSRRRGS